MLGLRIVTAAFLFAAFVLAVCYASRAIWILLCAAALVIAAWEWGRLANLPAKANVAYSSALVLGTCALAVLDPSPTWVATTYAAAVVFWIAAAPAWLWLRTPIRQCPLLAAAGAITLVPAFVALIRLRDTGTGLLLAVMASVWISDTAAYLVGRRFGHTKLAPAVSPGKTWEGLLGASIAVLLYAVAWFWWAPQVFPHGAGSRALPPAVFSILLLGFAGLGVLGDLFESLMKRNAGVKDSGALLPGHGGMLDRIDALLPVLPAAAWIFGQ
jgi:phosphatidate cytidylyltransferase